MKSRFLFWIATVSCVLNVVARAEVPEKPKFKDDPIRLEAKANVKFEVALRPLLVNPQITTPITWSIRNQPAWLQLNKQAERLEGTPTPADAGVFDFRGITVNADDIGGDFDHRVVLSVFAPPIWADQDIDLGIQNEGKPFTFDLKSVITDPAGGTLTFTATNRPKWMSLNGSILSGTPERSDVGDYSGIAFTATGKGGTSSATGHGKVLKTLKPPKWVAKEISIDDAFEDKAYNRNVTEFALNPEGTPLEYEIVSVTPPPWIQIGKTSGTLFGTPRKANIGAVSVSVILKTKIDGVSFDDTTTFKFNVIHVNHAPVWAGDPINLPAGLTKVKYEQDLGPSASDPDTGDVLTFKIVSFTGPGPNWATINSSTGVLTGTPDKANLGSNSWLVSVTDQGGLTDTATVVMTVQKSNEPPFWNNDPTVLPNANEDKSYQQDLSDFATDPDGDALTFTKLDGPSWITISPSGILTGTPKNGDEGTVSFRVKVDDLKSGSDVTDVKIIVLPTNHAPTWVLNPIQHSTKEESPIDLTISQFAKDVDNDKLTFSLIEGPAWATLTPEGKFVGTPQTPNVGLNTFKVRVMDTEGLFADAVVKINVLHVNHKPFWTENPITLPAGQEGVPYSRSLTDFARDPDGDVLTYTKISGPAWVTIGSSGTLSGTPSRVDVGMNFIEVRIMDPSHELADTTVKIDIQKVNKPPRWRQNPIQMGEALEDTTFIFNLADFAVDDDGDTLTFRLVDFTGPGSAWMFVGEDGKTTGVPMKANLGNFTATFEVSDGQGGKAQTKGVGVVIHKNHPPVISPELPEFRIKERQIFSESLNQPKYVADPDGDKLNFVMEDTSDFVTMSANGDIVAKPLRKHVGQHQFRFKVDDGQFPVHAILRIVVLKDPRPPFWIVDPITDKAKTNEPYHGMLADKARDLDGERLSFSKVSGPAWLTVSGTGDMGGTSKDADLGPNSFKVRACNESGLCTDATLNINVEPGTKEDVYAVDEPIPNAKVENLWVVDNSSHCDKTIKELKKHINVYYNELHLAKFPIQHKGVFLSSDAHKWDGLPIRDVGQGMLMAGADATSASSDFIKRVDAGYSNGSCGNCYNSPIWAMFRFYDRLPGLAEIYHNGFMMPQIPMDAMIVTNQKDHYPYYAKNQPQKPWKPADYAREFTALHTKESKPYRVSAIAPACPSLLETLEDGVEGVTTAAENAYRIVVDATSGRYYQAGCQLDMPAYLRDYAQRVIFRAYVHGKNRIRLSATPIQTNTITLTIGNVVIPGNTSSAGDKWFYEPSTNEVVIFWHLIDNGQIKPGDQIKIKFRVS